MARIAATVLTVATVLLLAGVSTTAVPLPIYRWRDSPETTPVRWSQPEFWQCEECVVGTVPTTDSLTSIVSNPRTVEVSASVSVKNFTLSMGSIRLLDAVQLTSGQYTLLDHSQVDCVTDAAHIVMDGGGRIVNSFPRCTVALTASTTVLTVDSATALFGTSNLMGTGEFRVESYQTFTLGGGSDTENANVNIHNGAVNVLPGGKILVNRGSQFATSTCTAFSLESTDTMPAALDGAFDFGMLDSGQCHDRTLTLTGSLAGYYRVYNGMTTVLSSSQLGPVSLVAVLTGLPLTLKSTKLHNVGAEITGFKITMETGAVVDMADNVFSLVDSSIEGTGILIQNGEFRLVRSNFTGIATKLDGTINIGAGCHLMFTSGAILHGPLKGAGLIGFAGSESDTFDLTATQLHGDGPYPYQLDVGIGAGVHHWYNLTATNLRLHTFGGVTTQLISRDGNWTDVFMKLSGPKVSWLVTGNHTRWHNVVVDLTDAELRFDNWARVHISGSSSVSLGVKGVLNLGNANIVVDEFHILGVTPLYIEHFFMVRRLIASEVSVFVDPSATLFLAGHSVINAKLLQNRGRMIMSSTGAVTMKDSVTLGHDSTLIININCMNTTCQWGGFYSSLIEAQRISVDGTLEIHVQGVASRMANGDLPLIDASMTLSGSFRKLVLPPNFPNAYFAVIDDERIVIRVGPSPDDGGLSGGAVAGIVISLLIVFALGGVGFYVYRRRHTGYDEMGRGGNVNTYQSTPGFSSHTTHTEL